LISTVPVVPPQAGGQDVNQMNKQERKLYRETLVAVPDDLKTLPNWVCFRMEERYGQPKPTKVPYNPISGDKAKANDKRSLHPAPIRVYHSC
jgi:hypothetical protein